MGERKGVNKYYPPDWHPDKGGINKYHGTHALRERARKLHLGILIIRFEMPYNIWCEGCGNHIGMGVRYNAEKKKVGMYYTTPIYQFRMKCHLCDNHFEIKTDPANLDYIIVSGARRQERRWDPTKNEQVVPEDKNTSKKLATDAMFQLEHGLNDASKSKKVAPSLARLEEIQGRLQDDYMANKRLRDEFRIKKKQLKCQAEKDAALLAKSSLSISLLPETEEDSKLASLLRLAPSQSLEEKQKEKREEIELRPLFDSPSIDGKQISQTRKDCMRESIKHLIRSGQKKFSHFKSSLSRASLGITVGKHKTSQEQHPDLKVMEVDDLNIVSGHEDYLNSDNTAGDTEVTNAFPETYGNIDNQEVKEEIKFGIRTGGDEQRDLECEKQEQKPLKSSDSAVSLVSCDYASSDSD